MRCAVVMLARILTKIKLKSKLVMLRPAKHHGGKKAPSVGLRADEHLRGNASWIRNTGETTILKGKLKLS
jgi:hypothetical protein